MKYLKLLYTAGLAGLLFFLFAAAETQDAKPKKIVFLAGPPSHGPGDHEFNAGCRLLAKKFNEQKDVSVEAIVHNGWPKNEEILDDADAVIIYSDATKVVKLGWDKMDALAKKGVGIMMMHYAVHPSPEEGKKYFLPWIGGYFENDFSVNPFWFADIKTLEGHPTGNGVGKIETDDEFYYNLRYTAKQGLYRLGVATPTKDNLVRINNLWTDAGHAAVGKPQALLWGIDRPDGGRGAGFTGGHYHKNWAYDEYRQLIMNTIAWVAGADIPEEGVNPGTVSEEELNENLDEKKGMKLIPLPPVNPKEGFTPGDLLTPEEHAEKRKSHRKPKKKAA